MDQDFIHAHNSEMNLSNCMSVIRTTQLCQCADVRKFKEAKHIGLLCPFDWNVSMKTDQHQVCLENAKLGNGLLDGGQICSLAYFVIFIAFSPPFYNLLSQKSDKVWLNVKFAISSSKVCTI